MEEKEVLLQIRPFPEDLKNKIKIQALKEGLTLQKFGIKVFTEYLKNKEE